MRLRIVLCILLFGGSASCLFAEEHDNEFDVDLNSLEFSRTYFSPGIQVGYTTGKGWFWGIQLTAGRDIIHSGKKVEIGNAEYLGLTNGIRFYSNDSHFYSDIQYSLLVAGAGFGVNWKVIDDKVKLRSYRIKSWLLIGLLPTFDLNFPSSDQDEYITSYGLIAVRPSEL